MGYIVTDSAPPQTTALAAVPPTNPLVEALKRVAPWVLLAILIFVVWQVYKRDKKKRGGSGARHNPRWRSLEQYDSGMKSDERREVLMRQVGREGYVAVLKRVVAMGNLNDDKNAKADAAWLQRIFKEAA